VADTWVDRFLRRNGLRVRRVKNFTMKTEEEIAGAAMKLHLYIYRCLSTCKIMFVIKFDEMPLSVPGRMGKVATITKVGAVDVRINHDAADHKRCATGIFGVSVFLDPSYAACRVSTIPPYLLLRENPSRHIC